MAKELEMAAVMNCFAVATASSTLCPLANSAVIAAAKVQPVPWVCLVWILGERRYKDSFLLINRSTESPPDR